MRPEERMENIPESLLLKDDVYFGEYCVTWKT